MAGKKKGGLASLYRHYDKIVAVLVLMGLLVSLLYLSQSSRRRQRDHEGFERVLSALRAKFPVAQLVDEAPYLEAQERMGTPFQMVAATNKPFLVAEERVWCVECRRPISFQADVCPYCQHSQPGTTVPEEWDSDGDGIPDSWERKYGLNPLDPEDAHHDLDGDGFTNLEEFQAGTDPTDPKSHPPRIDFLRVAEIEEVPFPLLLLGSIKGPDGRSRFQIKDKAEDRDYYVSEGQDIGKTGYKVSGVEVRKEKRVVPGWTEPREVDVHFVTVSKGETAVVLEAGEPGKSSDYSFVFRCLKGRAQEDIPAESGKSFMFDQEEYEVISVDRNRQAVVIRRLSDQKQFSLPRL